MRNHSKLMNRYSVLCLFALALTALAQPAGAQRGDPSSLKIISGQAAQGVLVELSDLKFDPSTPFQFNSPVRGTAVLTLRIPGGKTGSNRLRAAPAARPEGEAAIQNPRAAFERFIVKPDGSVAQGGIFAGGTYAFSDLSGTGVNLTIGPGIEIDIGAKAGDPLHANVIGPMKMNLPYYSMSGRSLATTIRSQVALSASGRYEIRAENADVVKGPSHLDNTFPVSGCSFAPDKLDVTLFGGIQSPDLQILSQSCFVNLGIPCLVTQEERPLSIFVSNFAMNLDARPDFTVNTSLGNAGADEVVHMVKPAGFAITVNYVQGEMKAGKLTKLWLMNSALALPLDVRNELGDRKELNIMLDGLTGKDLNGKMDQFDPNGKLFEVNGATISTKQYVIDLTEEAAPDTAGIKDDSVLAKVKDPKWQGILIRDNSVSGAVVSPPDEFQTANKWTAFGFTIDSHGVNGSSVMDLQGLSVLGFDVTANPGDQTRKFVIQNSQPQCHSLTATLHLPTHWQGTIPIALDMFAQPPGIALSLDTTQTFTRADLGGLKIAPTAVAFSDLQGSTSDLLVSGEMSFEGKVGGAVFDISEMGIVPGSGALKIKPGSTLTHGASVAVGSATVSVNDMRFDSAPDRITLKGPVTVAPNIPTITNFPGIVITSNPQAALLQGLACPPPAFDNPITFTIPIDVEVAGIGIKGQLGPDANDPKAVSGLVNLSIPALGAVGLGDAKFTFLVGPNYWSILGGVDLVVPIQLSPSPIFLHGFHGGAGYNMVSKTGKIDDVHGHPGDLIHDPNDGKSLFIAAGVTVGDVDKSLLWGDVTLSLFTSPFAANLYGKFYLLSTTPTEDRTADANLSYTNGVLHGAAHAILRIPGGGLGDILHAEGSMDLLVSKAETHFYVGWPINVSPISVKILGGPSISGGVGIDFKNGAATMAAGILYSASWGPLSGEIDGAVTVIVGANPSLSGQVHASGSVDFGIASLTAEAMLAVAADKSGISLNGEFDACFHNFIHDIDVSVGFSTHIP